MLRAGGQRLLRGALRCSGSGAQQTAAVAAAQQQQQQAPMPAAWWAAAAHQLLGWAGPQQPLHTSTCQSAVSAQQPQHFVHLSALRPAAGGSKLAKRWGRGDGGDRGTYCGRGVKGQKARKGTGKPRPLFDGGQNQMTKFPKVGLTPSSPVLYKQLSLGKVLRWVQLGLLDPAEVITMKDLRDAGCISKTIRWGVELVAKGTERVEQPLHLQVSSVSLPALQAVEAAGGSVTRVYYTRLGLRALLKPEAFAAKGRVLPRPVRAWPPREQGKFDVVGALPPPRALPPAAPALAL